MSATRGALVDRCDRCGALLVRIRPDQHAAVEAVYEDMAEQLDYPQGSGQMLTADEWHQVILNGFAKEMGWTSKLLPSMDGRELVPVMRTKQSRLTKRQGSELIEFTKAYATNRGAIVRAWDEEGNLIDGPHLHQAQRRAA